MIQNQFTNGFTQTSRNSIANLFVLINQRATDNPLIRKLLNPFVFLNA